MRWLVIKMRWLVIEMLWLVVHGVPQVSLMAITARITTQPTKVMNLTLKVV